MATQRQIEANRRNAQKSTGPKTQAGRDRSRLNALKHGLSRMLPASDPVPPPVLPLAQAIVGEAATHPEALALAEVVAAESLTLLAIRRRRTELIAGQADAACPNTPPGLSTAGADAALEVPLTCHAEGPASSVGRTERSCPADLVRDLSRLDRYERRAIARRSRALRALEDVLARRATPAPSSQAEN
jgi:hypothetical protein